MKLSGPEARLLFAETTFLADPPSQVLVLFPPTYKPEPEELAFLKTIFAAVHWPIWETRYFIKDESEIPSGFKDIPYYLFFGFDGPQNQEVRVVEKGGTIEFYFPEINQFQSNHAIKTLVWKALKPYALQSKS